MRSPSRPRESPTRSISATGWIEADGIAASSSRSPTTPHRDAVVEPWGSIARPQRRARRRIEATHRAYSSTARRRDDADGQRDGSEPKAVSRRHDQYAPRRRNLVAIAIEARLARPAMFASRRRVDESGPDRIGRSLRPASCAFVARPPPPRRGGLVRRRGCALHFRRRDDLAHPRPPPRRRSQLRRDRRLPF